MDNPKSTPFEKLLGLKERRIRKFSKLLQKELEHLRELKGDIKESGEDDYDEGYADGLDAGLDVLYQLVENFEHNLNNPDLDAERLDIFAEVFAGRISTPFVEEKE